MTKIFGFFEDPKMISFCKSCQKVFKMFRLTKSSVLCPLSNYLEAGRSWDFKALPNGAIFGSSKVTLLTGQKSSVFVKKFSLFDQNFSKMSKNEKIYKNYKNEKKCQKFTKMTKMQKCKNDIFFIFF